MATDVLTQSITHYSIDPGIYRDGSGDPALKNVCSLKPLDFYCDHTIKNVRLLKTWVLRLCEKRQIVKRYIESLGTWHVQVFVTFCEPTPHTLQQDMHVFV